MSDKDDLRADEPPDPEAAAVSDTPAPSVEPKRSLEDRVKGLEHRLKLATIAISLCALVAPAASAVAAWFSWQTATQSLDVAQSNLQTAGALISVSGTLKTAGSCEDPSHPFVARLNFNNEGRTPGHVVVLAVTMRLENGENMIVARMDAPTVVNPYDQVGVDMKVDCEAISHGGFNGLIMPKLADYAKENGEGWLLMHVQYGVGGSLQLPIYDVWYQGLIFSQ
ncbi:hypothetical protein [Mycolicibacterium sp. P1-18]|uniref:hypothetical protein n=1 Tax=Mycolicibacterium sp. P1-18 TaxID=2024615 RepID=UPI0011F2F92A|nr:hypothetical protein [Mycolicibacterium sp. P1-18]